MTLKYQLEMKYMFERWIAASDKVTNRAKEAMRAVLPNSAEVSQTSGPSTDLLVNGIPVRVKWIGEGDLRHARAALASEGPAPDIIAARHLSPGARALLSQAGVGWVDETGAAEIALPSLVVSRSGRTPEVRERTHRWTPATLAVAEALLCGANPTVAAAARSTGLSMGTCATALRTLTTLGLLTALATRGPAAGRRLDDPRRLLDAYATAATAVRAAPSLRVSLPSRELIASLGVAGAAWTEAGIDWAATGLVAGEVLAPHLTSVNTAEAYVAADTLAELERAAQTAGLRPIEGGRLTLRPFPTVATARLATTQHGLRLAPWPRVYADLRTSSVRGEEAAEHLWEVVRGV